MNILALLILIFTAFAVASAVVLCRAAFVKPRIGALVERAAVAVLIAFFGVIYSVIAINTDAGRALLSMEAARIIVRSAVIALLALPTVWSALYFTRRLGSAVCAVTTEAWGRCPLGNVSIVRVNGTGSEDLILPLCQTHAAMFGAKA